MILSETSSDFLHALVQVRHIVFPKETFVPGNWAVFVCDVFDVFSGEPYDTETIRVKGCVYSLDIGGLYNLKAKKEIHPTYGPTYQIVSFNKEFNLQNASYRRMFLESLYTPLQVELSMPLFLIRLVSSKPEIQPPFAKQKTSSLHC